MPFAAIVFAVVFAGGGQRAAAGEPAAPGARFSDTAELTAPRGGAADVAPGGAADARASAAIGGASACPTPEAVGAELETLVPPVRLGERLRALAGDNARLEIVDQGGVYRILAAGRVREYRDAARDCEHRARVAAVFMALSLDPADLFHEGPAPSAAPALVRIDVAALIEGGFGSGGNTLEGGVALRVSAGRGVLGFAAGAAALWPVDTRIGGVALRQWRLPFDVGVRAQVVTGRLLPYAEAGLAVALLSEQASDLARTPKRTVVEVGARFGAGIYLPVPALRMTPFLALHLEVVPSPPAIFALPRGDVGNTPSVWLGGTLGVSFGWLP